MKKLGFGLMRLPITDPSDRSSIDIEQAKKMVDIFISRGFTYFDTAWMYHNFNSEKAVKEILTDRYPEGSYTLATKLHVAFLHSKEDRDKIFDEQLKKTGVRFFDYYLLHDMGSDHYETAKQYDCFEWLKEKKDAGLVKHMGFSFHDNAATLDRILTEHPEMEFVQLQVNYLDWENEGIQSRKCCEVARKHKKPIIVMEPVKGGTLANIPDEAEALFREKDKDASVSSWAVRFAASLDGVMLVLSGMSNIAQMEENTSFMENFVPLDDEEIKIPLRAAEIINSKPAIHCTGCSYCTDGCPQNIAIPRYFSLYNADIQECKDKDWLPQKEYYARLTSSFGKASDCIECGNCESICPQHLHIIKDLKRVARRFER